MDVYPRPAGGQQHGGAARGAGAAAEPCGGPGRPSADHEDYPVPLPVRDARCALPRRHAAALQAAAHAHQHRQEHQLFRGAGLCIRILMVWFRFLDDLDL